jgi:5-hydroxyisourate hydrolase
MMHISTHVLDLCSGQPAREVRVRLERREAAGNWQPLAGGSTDAEGRCLLSLAANQALTPGIYRLAFATEAYFAERKLDSLYPSVEITFRVREGEQHFHIPLLLGPHGYTTYRGS